VGYELDTDASAGQLDKLISLTERYCVVCRMLRKPPAIEVSTATTAT
jgi:uncharacterized OsmC-like protein